MGKHTQQYLGHCVQGLFLVKLRGPYMAPRINHMQGKYPIGCIFFFFVGRCLNHIWQCSGGSSQLCDLGSFVVLLKGPFGAVD